MELTLKKIIKYGITTQRISVRSRVGKGSMGSSSTYRKWSVTDVGTLIVSENSLKYIGGYDLITANSSQIELIVYSGGWFKTATGIKIHFKGNKNPIMFKVNKKIANNIISLMNARG